MFANSGAATTIANAAELAAAIGPAVGADVPQPGAIATAGNAAGTRLVNNLTVKTAHTFSAVGDSFTVNCAQGVSFALAVACSRTTVGLGIASNEFRVDWFDSSGTILLDTTTYEVNGSDSPAAILNSVVNDQCLGPIAKVTWVANNDTTPGGLPVCTANFVLQTVSSNRLRVTEYTAAGPFFPGGADASGFLFRTGPQILAAAATAGPFQCAPANGPLVITVNGVSTGTVGAQFRVRGGFGFASFNAGELNLLTAAALPALGNSTALIQQLGAVPARPFWFNLTNVGSQPGNGNVEIWTNPD